MVTLSRTLVSIPLVLGSVCAQMHESRGPLAGAATAVAVDGGLGVGTDAQTRAHRNGFGGNATLVLPPASNPPDLHHIFQMLGAPAGIDVDDISLGRDEVLVNSSGFLAVPPGSWGVLSFSLRQGATGEPNSRIAAEAALGSIGSALFSWVLPGSTLPQLLVARTERSHSGRDLGLPVGSEVDSVDFPVMLGRNQGSLGLLEPGFGALIAFPEEIYFTVSHATRALVPASWWTPYNPAFARSGATILVTRRSATGAPWGQPTVHSTWQDLGLDQDDDVDGLAVDAVADKLLFSVVGNAYDQLLFADRLDDGGGAPIVVKTSTGTPVSDQIGKGQSDDVDAVCTLDPVLGSQGGPPPGGDDFGSSCGAPRSNYLLGTAPSVHASAFRRRTGPQTYFDTWMVGWPPNTGPSAGIAVLFMTIGDDTTTLVPVGPIHLRDTTDPVPGNPCTFSWPLPPAPWPLSGARVTFRWLAISAGFTEFAEAWPVQVCL